MDQKDNLVYIPVSYGELFDKISILNIKSTECKNDIKLHNINKELRLLENLDAYKNNIDKISSQYTELIKVNTKLWWIEDQLRGLESLEIFNLGFINKARQVYKLNDKRSQIKKEINEILRSELVEEKLYGEY